MNTINVIKNRRSIREFSSKEISSADLKQILEAGMKGPSCVNSQDWCFIVVRDRNTLNKMADCNGKAAEPLRKANVGIMICADLNKSYPKVKDYFVIDCSIATQNIILAATELGIGSVWLGTYPQGNKVEGQRELFNLPNNIIPHSIVALGYPLDETELKKGSRSEYIESNVHYEKW